MRLGKLSEKDLVPLLRYAGAPDPSIILGPRFGEDAGVVAIEGGRLVAACDPVTFAVEDIGWYAVHINANDVAASGADPRWFLCTILLPEICDEDLPEQIFRQVDEACRQIQVGVLGGHTEVAPGLTRPIVCGTMLGLAGEAGVIATGGARPGDAVILTKGACIEGAALLARERPAEARQALGEERWHRALAFLRAPGLSVVEDARVARETVRVHAMHDPTEGGVLAGLYELARASGTGIEVEDEPIPVPEEARVLCEHFGLDPLRTLASGALIVCVAPGDAAALLAAYRERDIRAAVVGRITEAGYRFRSKGLEYPLAHDGGDEITRMIENG